MIHMSIKNKEEFYTSPSCEVIELKSQAIICQSGNEWSNEEDWGDGGFSGWN